MNPRWPKGGWDTRNRPAPHWSTRPPLVAENPRAPGMAALIGLLCCAALIAGALA